MLQNEQEKYWGLENLEDPIWKKEKHHAFPEICQHFGKAS